VLFYSNHDRFEARERYAAKLAVVTVEAAQIRFIALLPFSARDMFKNALAVIKLHF
jgi:hypothetical protein